MSLTSICSPTLLHLLYFVARDGIDRPIIDKTIYYRSFFHYRSIDCRTHFIGLSIIIDYRLYSSVKRWIIQLDKQATWKAISIGRINTTRACGMRKNSSIRILEADCGRGMLVSFVLLRMYIVYCWSCTALN